MPIDSEVAKERIWKEHCEKMVMQSIRFQQDGRSHAEFTMNPYHLHHNKPVSEPVSTRAKDFLDRPKATLQALSARLAASGLDPASGKTPTFDESSPRNVAHINKSRAVKGNNIFGTAGASAESKKKLFEDWSEVLNQEIGGVKSFREGTGSFLPPISNSRQSSPAHSINVKGGAPSPLSPSKIVASPTSPKRADFAMNDTINSTPGKSARDDVVQELLLRSTKPPTLKYTRPQTEAQVLGWDAQRAPKANPMFTYLHKSCDMTRFAAESGHSPTKKSN